MMLNIMNVLFFFAIAIPLSSACTPADDIISDNPEDIHFYLYLNKTFYTEIRYLSNQSELEKAGYKFGGDLSMVMDGFTSNFETPMSTSVRDALLEKLDANNNNVVVVDWKKMSGGCVAPPLTTGHYLSALGNAKSFVGPRMKKIICWLRTVARTKRVHVIGHSLGGVAAHFAGQEVVQNCAKLERISALDPAGPFITEHPMSKEDGIMVDTYHTNNFYGASGYANSTLNFFINGGYTQPGCPDETPSLCDHSYSWKIFVHSFKNLIEGCPCAKKPSPISPIVETCRCKITNPECTISCDNPLQVGYNVPEGSEGNYRVTFDKELQKIILNKV